MRYNPLSYSQRVHCDLKALVKDALSSLNVPVDSLQYFDTHSTITIALNNCPDLHLSIFRDRLMIWASIGASEIWRLERSGEIIQAITQPMLNVENEGVCLVQAESEYELRALVNLDNINAATLANVIKDFEQILRHFDHQ